MLLKTWEFAVAKPRRSTNTIVAALPRVMPTILLAAIFVVPLATGRYLPFTSAQSLGVIVQVEWLVVAGGLFLVFALVLPITSSFGRCLTLAYVLVVSAAIAATGAWAVDGFYAVILFYVLLVFSYGLNTLLPGKRAGYADSIFFMIRWIVLIFVFFGLAGVIGLPERVERWHGHDTELLGALFFSSLSLLDLTVFNWLQHYVNTKLQRLSG